MPNRTRKTGFVLVKPKFAVLRAFNIGLLTAQRDALVATGGAYPSYATQETIRGKNALIEAIRNGQVKAKDLLPFALPVRREKSPPARPVGTTPKAPEIPAARPAPAPAPRAAVATRPVAPRGKGMGVGYGRGY